MTRRRNLFFDVGGVILTNGWDTESRQLAAESFQIDFQQLESRHEPLFEPLERAEISLDEYLDVVVFYQKRDFTREEFLEFMKSRSRPHESSIEVIEQLAATGKYRLFTLNNESRELNLYRIEKFGLQRFFIAFFSSCFIGVRKPRRRIYETALLISQSAPGESLFIDDREVNIECSQTAGMRGVHLAEPAALEQTLRAEGVEI